ncbi:hypothetical protein OIV83_004684 [Microbotryomycetes sp. JL201]|nr:hypothetical protein OIV83_004684 [Microbotryomycetes sp. JL201]
MAVERLPPELVERIASYVVEYDHHFLVNGIPNDNDPFHVVEDWQPTVDRVQADLVRCALVHRTWTDACLRLLWRVIVVPDLFNMSINTFQSPRFIQRARSCSVVRIFKLSPSSPRITSNKPDATIQLVKTLFGACCNAKDVFIAVLNPSHGLWRVIAEHGLDRLQSKSDSIFGMAFSTLTRLLIRENPPPLSPPSAAGKLRHLSVKSMFPLSLDWLRPSFATLEHLTVEFNDDVYDTDVDRAARLLLNMTSLLKLCVPHVCRLTFKDLRLDSARHERPHSSVRLPLVEILSSGASASKLGRLRLSIDRSLGYESLEYVRHLKAVPPSVKVLELGEFYPLPQVRSVLVEKDDVGRHKHLVNLVKICVVDASTTRWTAMRTSVDHEQKLLRSVCEQRGIELDVQVVF